MSKRLPKPNVCRIEVLDGEARRAYMGGFQKSFQASLDTFRETMLDAIALESGYDMYEPFYGILNADTGNGPSFSVKANWSEPKGNKSGFARMNTILTGGGGNAGLLGAIPGIGSAISRTTNSVLGGIESVAQVGMELSGINNNCTGSMTIKKFTGAQIDAALPLKFRWYLPEQEDMCRQSLKRLVMMTYVRPMDMQGDAIVNEMINGLVNAGSQLVDSAKQMIDNVTSGYYSSGDSSYKEGNSSSSNSGKAEPGSVKDVINKVIGSGVDIYNNLNTFFGGEITANPLPVRVSIGHYLDFEPMVINSVRIQASNEQFISPDGTHLPVFINAEVQVSYWMQPGPTKDFISILGNEVFSQFIKYPSKNGKSGKNKNDGGISKNNNPSKNKKR